MARTTTDFDPAQLVELLGELFSPAELRRRVESSEELRPVGSSVRPRRRDEQGAWQLNGLYRDLVTWQLKAGDELRAFEAVLHRLSVPGELVLRLGQPRRLRLGDTQEYPTLALPNGDTALPLASAGIQAICNLAYLLVWSWSEQRQARVLIGEPLAPRSVLLVDEIEAHLHPRWQRIVLPALLSAASSLSEDCAVQLLASTHSPLVMASLGPHFDADRDAVVELELQPGSAGGRAEVVARPRPPGPAPRRPLPPSPARAGGGSSPPLYRAHSLRRATAASPAPSPAAPSPARGRSAPPPPPSPARAAA